METVDIKDSIALVQILAQKQLNSFFIYLFLSCSSSALGKLAVVVHGSRPASRRLAILPSLWVQHPPWTLACPFVLHANKAAVQRQVVSNGVLEERKKRARGKSPVRTRQTEICVCPFPKTVWICFTIRVQIHLHRWLTFKNRPGFTADLQRRKERL